MAVTKNAKPSKPYSEFPLFAHASGQWAKKIKSKMWYFGTDPDEALKRYLDEVNDIQAGRDPRRLKKAHVSPGELSVYDMCNLYLSRLQKRADSQDITQRHFSESMKSMLILTKHFGKFQSAATLKADDFTAFRESFPTLWGQAKTKVEISRIKTCFRWAFESELIPALPNFGPGFKAPTKSVTRRDQQQRQAARGGKLDFSAAEIRKLLKASSGWLHACILLGINCGLGNADCGRLESTFIQAGWYDLPRHKTGVPRRFRLWPETIAAIQQAMAERKTDSKLCFLTTKNNPIWCEHRDPKSGLNGYRDRFGTEFQKLLKNCGIARAQRGFYSLRRTFETVAGGSKDQIAVDVVMGHSDASMGALYRQGIDDQRLIDVGQHVHKWLFGK